MNFALSDEQQLLRETARGLLAKECPISLVRDHAEDPSSAQGLWKHLSEWVELGDGSLVDLCLFLEQAGEVLAPGPFFATTALYRPLMAALGRTPAETGTIAAAGASGQWPFTGAVDGNRTRTFVIEADAVDETAILVPGPGVIVTTSLPARRMETLDTTRRVFEIDVPMGEHSAEPLSPEALRDVLDRGAVALSAELVGTARRILDMTVAYAKERVQFDRPIGSFQAVQHKLADMALDVERATAAVYYAAMTVDADDPDRHRAVHVAKAAAGRAATHAAKDGIQLHGGIGYTWEHDLHLFMRRAYASEYLMGTSAWHHERLADLLFGTAG
ncbi:MAG TPA: acyl-CoA dehydrogenase family protein [Acidimicrobiia bacterium]|nr:acyl-CoA dehydrogenase family protein [Acidimicrobiia bacterium]